MQNLTNSTTIASDTFTVTDLYNGIKQIQYPMNSSTGMRELKERSIDRLLYREISNFKKLDLESYQLGEQNTNLLLHLVLACRNSFLFAGLIKTGAFVEALSPLSNWIIKNTNSPSLDLYENVFNMECQHNLIHKNKIFKGNLNEDVQTMQVSILMDYLANMDTPEKFNLAQKFFHDWGQQYASEIIDKIFQTEKPTAFNEFIVSQFKANDIDINKGFPLNDLLPDNKNNWSDTQEESFFISSSHIPRLTTLLDYGFVFDEEKYRFKDDTLFMAVIMSKRADIINCIIPHITNVCSVKLPRVEQEEIIESLSAKNYYKDIKSTYFKGLFETLIPNKNISNLQKIKI